MGPDNAEFQAYLYAERKYKATAEEEVAALYFGTVAAELGLGNIVQDGTINRITSKIKSAVGVADDSRTLSRRVLSAVAKYNRVQNAKARKGETRNKIKRQIQKLRTMSEHPTKEKNVKIDMQEFASTALTLTHDQEINIFFILSNSIAYSLLRSVGQNEQNK